MSWHDEWVGFWAGDWFGPLEQVEGAISGQATISVSAAGSATGVLVPAAAQPSGGFEWWPRSRRRHDEDEPQEEVDAIPVPVLAERAIAQAERRVVMRIVTARADLPAVDEQAMRERELAAAFDRYNLALDALHAAELRRRVEAQKAHHRRLVREDEEILLGF